MKFKYLFALPIIATALIGCDDIEVSDARPVENPQLPGITQEDFEVVPSEALTGVMNLEELASETSDPATFMIDLYEIKVLTEDLPETAVLRGGLEFSATPEFEMPYVVDGLEVNDGVASAPLSSLLTTRDQMFGKAPKEYQVYYRIPVYVILDGAQYKIGTKDSFFCEGNSFMQEGLAGADFDYLYTPGNANGWDQLSSQKLYTSDYEIYHGYAYLDGEFKFTSEDNWNGINYGAGSSEGTMSTDGGAGNITAPAAGLYWVEVNVNELTYKLTPITAISMIGGFNDWAGDVELTPSADYLTWTGTMTLDAPSAWKFRMNNDWAHNLGGSVDDLVADGSDLNSDAGTYTVTLDLSKLPYSCTVVAK